MRVRSTEGRNALASSCALRKFYMMEDQTARNCHHAVVMTLPSTGESNNTKWKTDSCFPTSTSSFKTKTNTLYTKSMTTSLPNSARHSAATLQTCITASGSSAFTWKIGASTTWWKKKPLNKLQETNSFKWLFRYALTMFQCWQTKCLRSKRFSVVK